MNMLNFVARSMAFGVAIGLGGFGMCKAVSSKLPHRQALMVMGSCFMVMLAASYLYVSEPPITSGDPLDTPLYWWTQRDAFSRRDLCRSVFIAGATGSGKSSGSLRALASAIIRDRSIGGCIPRSKPEELAFFRKIFKEQRGSDDTLIIFGPGHPIRINFIEHLTTPKDVRDFVMTVTESVMSGHEGDSEKNPFWRNTEGLWIEGAATIINLAYGKMTADDIHKFIMTMANSPAERVDEKWIASSFHRQTFGLAEVKRKTAIERHDFDRFYDLFILHCPVMDKETRSNVTSGILARMAPWASGQTHELTGKTTNCPLSVLENGKWIFADFGDDVEGRFIKGGLKYIVQRHILARETKPKDGIVCIIADEFGKIANSFDASALAEIRSHNGAMICAAQSIHSVFAAMKGGSSEHLAKSLLSNFGTLIAHTVDSETAEYFTSLIGKRLTTFISGSTQPAEDSYSHLFGGQKQSTGFSEHYEDILQTASLMGGLRQGGPGNNYLVDALVVKRGERFSIGESFLFHTFTQR